MNIAVRLLIILVIALIPTIIAASGEGEKVGEVKLEVELSENIDFPKVEIKVKMFPGETKQEDILFTNKASVDSEVNLYLELTPDLQGVTAAIQKDFVVPANESVTKTVTIKARNNSIIDDYFIVIEVFRK